MSENMNWGIELLNEYVNGCLDEQREGKKTYSLRYFDSNAEKEVAAFLDETLYVYLKEKKAVVIKRERDKNEQLKGIDCTWKYEYEDKFWERNVDEKARVHFINQPPREFGMECSFMGYNEETKAYDECRHGWFINKDLQTDAYLLCYYIHADEKLYPPLDENWKETFKNLKKEEIKDSMGEYFKTLEAEDIDEIRCIFIDKALIKKYLQEFIGEEKCVDEWIKEKSNELRNNDIKEIKVTDSISIKISKKLEEKPINIFIPIEELVNLATVNKSGKCYIIIWEREEGGKRGNLTIKESKKLETGNSGEPYTIVWDTIWPR